jgi:hypothetical protein
VDQVGIQFLRQKGDNVRGHGLVHPEALVGRVAWTDRDGKRRFLLLGRGLAWNRLHGFWAWGGCLARERASRLRRRFQRKEGALRPAGDAAGPCPTKEQEILILVTRLELSDIHEARMGVLLKAGPSWASLLDQGTRFGLLPLLHHHLSRPNLATMVPEGTRVALSKAYHRTSLKNLRMLGLLRRFLLKTQEAGVDVILLKGAFLANWAYGDVGLRPMNDLDLLCHKEDEPAIRKILEGMGGFRSKSLTERDPDLSPLRVLVDEKTNHSAPWWFPDICRIEIHYHLLSRATVDDGWLQEAFWTEAVARDWDGLEVCSLAPQHQVIHLASHLHHHLEEQVLNMYWVADLREVLHMFRSALDPSALMSLARRLGLEPDCASVFRLVGEPWGGEPGLDDEGSIRAVAARMDMTLRAPAGNPVKRTVSGYIAMVRNVRHVSGGLDKARYLRDLCFPPPWKLAREYRTTSRLMLPLLYLVHPLARLLQGFRGTLQNVQRRLGH